MFQIEEDAYQEDLGLTLGSLGKAKSGRVRGPVIDSKTKARISKTLQVFEMMLFSSPFQGLHCSSFMVVIVFSYISMEITTSTLL